MKHSESKAAKIRAYVKANPTAKAQDVAKATGAHHTYVYGVIHKMKNKVKRKIIKLVKRPQTPEEFKAANLIAKHHTDVSQPRGTEELLKQRGIRYGTFAMQAQLSQTLKNTLMAHANRYEKHFAPDQAEAITMIVHKLARIVNGDPNYGDSWRDIEGYAKLVADRLEHGKVV
jgi:hypothetical protein